MFENDNERFQAERFDNACWGEEWWLTERFSFMWLLVLLSLLVFILFISQ
jgi:hypothetical protein